MDLIYHEDWQEQSDQLCQDVQHTVDIPKYGLSIVLADSHEAVRFKTNKIDAIPILDIPRVAEAALQPNRNCEGKGIDGNKQGRIFGKGLLEFDGRDLFQQLKDGDFRKSMCADKQQV